MPMILGLAGLLPAFLCLAGVLFGGTEWRFASLAAGFGYSALIYSFLGGLWWGLASAPGAPDRPWVYGAAVMPSLIAFALYLPWVFGLEWPGPSLVWLGVAILASPIGDSRLVSEGLAPGWWMKLRWPLSIGLGLATLIMGCAALLAR